MTRLCTDARGYHLVVVKPKANGRPPKWGLRLATLRHHRYWPLGWQVGRAWGYGRVQRFQYKQLWCRRAVSAPAIPVHVFAGALEGYKEPWCLVTIALDLTAAQVVEVFTVRSRQENAFRNHKQRLGMEECRAWTKKPRLGAFQVQLVTLTLQRLLQARLNQAWGLGTCWLKPEWNPYKRHGSTLNLRRLLWRHRRAFSQLLVDLEILAKLPLPPALQGDLTGRAA
jgi:hypothetical protein